MSRATSVVPPSATPPAGVTATACAEPTDRNSVLRLAGSVSVARLSGASLRLGSRRVLDGVDLELWPASVFVLFGVNGAGKTTLMRTLCGRTRLDGGHVTVLGNDPRTHAAVRRAIGFVPQSIALYPALTARENLEAFAGLAGRDRADPDRLATVMKAVRIEHVADRKVRDLSGGYQRRVNLGAALMTAPSLLLLDEPTVGLDVAAKEVMVEIIRDAAAAGAAILLATHDFDVAAAVADRVGFLANGRIAMEGTLPDLLAQHFADRVQARLRLSGTADVDLDAAFRRAGLVFAPDIDTWHGPDEGLEPSKIDAVLAAVSGSRCSVRTLDVTQPALRHLFDVFLRRDH